VTCGAVTPFLSAGGAAGRDTGVPAGDGLAEGAGGRAALRRLRVLMGNLVLGRWMRTMEADGGCKGRLPTCGAHGHRLTEDWMGHQIGTVCRMKVSVLDRHTEQTKPISTMFLWQKQAARKSTLS
jgi:hypothetical protein